MRTRLFLLLALALGSRTVAQAQEAQPISEAKAEPQLGQAQISPEGSAPVEANEPSREPPQGAPQALQVGTQEPHPTTIQEEPLALPAENEADFAAGETTLSAAELGSLGLELSNPGLDTSLRFSGFADFTSYTPINPRGAASTLLPRHSSFYVGNLNLYLSKNLSESFRTMAEVRFTYLPNGSVSGGTLGAEPIRATALDYADNSRTVRWGGIMLQRVYLEWTLHRLAVVRAGQFLTPYGIWNVDHGSPAYIPVQRPYAVNSSYFPERQTGLELFGRVDVSNFSTLGYHLTLSNGMGPISEYKDLDDNKAVGGRLYWESHRIGYFRLGASGNYGRNTDALTNVSFGANSIKISDRILTQYDALALAADLIFKFKGLHFQTEWVSQQRRYTKDGRTAHGLVLGPVARGFAVDSMSWGGYGLLAYQLSWFGLTPYVMAQYNTEIIADTVFDRRLKTVVMHAGLNLHPVDAVTFKGEFQYSDFIDGGVLFSHAVRAVQFQAAWAF